MPSYESNIFPPSGKMILQVSYQQDQQLDSINHVLLGKGIIPLGQFNEGYLKYAQYELFIPVEQAQHLVTRLRGMGFVTKFATE